MQRKFNLPSGGYKTFRRGRSLVTACRPERKKKNIFMLTTGHTAEFTTISRRSRAKPAVVHLYNQSMNGVDISDQLSVYYCFNRKSVKWWRKVFFWCIEIAIINSHQKYKSISLATTHLSYRRSIVDTCIHTTR